MSTWEHALGRDDQAWALEIGAKRQAHAERDGKRDQGKQMTRREALSGHVVGAYGELGTGRIRGWEWPALVDTYGRVPDYPDQGVEVKTRPEPFLDLPVRRRTWQGRGTFDKYYALVWANVSVHLELVGVLDGDRVRRELAQVEANRYGVKHVPWEMFVGRNG